jgi:hypothetical protein
MLDFSYSGDRNLRGQTLAGNRTSTKTCFVSGFNALGNFEAKTVSQIEL